MKLGLILECTKEGPDKAVYEYVISKLCAGMEVESVTLDNKKNLIEGVGKAAASLLATGCDQVVVLWDLMPPWGGEVCRKSDCDKIIADLETSKVDLGKVKLVCVEAEMESWMIVDGRGVTDYFQSKSSRKLEPFGDKKRADEQSKPKDKIRRYNKRYNDYIDNIGIVKRLPDFNMAARWNDSFKRFKEFVVSKCPTT